MVIATNNYNLVSLGYYGQEPEYRERHGRWGQKPKESDYPQVLTIATPWSYTKEPETYTEKWKRYAWTVLPLLTLIRPVGSGVTVISEMTKIAKSIDGVVKHRSLYPAFQTVLSAGTIAATVIEPLSPPLRSLLLGIQLLSLAHQTALKVYRHNLAVVHRDKMALRVVSNLLAMASIVFPNTFVISIFFLIQAAEALSHALEQFLKEKYLSASVKVVMGSVRLFQGFALLLQSLNEYEEREAALQLQETASISQIDPREKIKEKLTAHEAKLKDLGGERFLYFKHNAPQEKFLILNAEAGHTRDPRRIASLINQLSKRFDVKFRTITRVDDIQREIHNAAQFGRVMGLLIHAHGDRYNMLLSDGWYTGWLDRHTVSAGLFAGLDPRCIIALQSCNTANVPGDGIAYSVANAAKRTTYASTGYTYDMTLRNLDPLEFSFKHFGWGETKKIEPLKTPLS